MASMAALRLALAALDIGRSEWWYGGGRRLPLLQRQCEWIGGMTPLKGRRVTLVDGMDLSPARTKKASSDRRCTVISGGRDDLGGKCWAKTYARNAF